MPNSLANRLLELAAEAYARVPIDRMVDFPEAMERIRIHSPGHAMAGMPALAITQMTEKLAERGYSKFRLLGISNGGGLAFRTYPGESLREAAGDHVLRVVDAAVRRFGPKLPEMQVSRHPAVLQPLHRVDASGGSHCDYIGEIVRRVIPLSDLCERGKLSETDAQSILVQLRKAVLPEHYATDLHGPENFGNAGLLRDGTPVVLDLEAVESKEGFCRTMNRAAIAAMETETAALEQIPTIFTWTHPDGGWKQNCLPAIPTPSAPRPSRSR